MPQWNTNSLDSPRVFYLREESTLADVAEKISRLNADTFRAASSLAFLSNTPIAFDAIAAKPLLQYAAEKPTVVLTPGPSFSIKADLIAPAGFSQLEVEPVVSKVRKADLLQLLEEDGGACAFEAHANYHFVTPSLTHTSRFMRIGDLLHNLHTLDQMAFWLRPYIGTADAILVDSWSIASAILRTLQINRLQIPFDCFPEHPAHNSIACQRVVEGLLARLPLGGRLVAFVSISGSGRLVEHIQTMFNERAAGRFTIECLSIYGFASTPNQLNCFARIPTHETFFQDPCELCASGSIPIHIDPAAYHLKSLSEPEVLLSKSHLAAAKPFIERYRDTKNLFIVHHDDRNDGRHHAFDLNMFTLFSHPEFAKRFDEKLVSLLGNVDLIVSPDHEAGKYMADRAKAVFGCPVIIHDTLDRNALSVNDLGIVLNARKILIVDDVVNSGSRLRQYIQSVREGHYLSCQMLSYLVALARPSTPQHLTELSKTLTDGHNWKGHFHAVEEIILPNWNEELCPWCREFDFISGIARRFARPPRWLTARLAKLRNRTEGISDEPILLLPGVSSVVLGDQSPICSGESSSMVVMFALASALQAQRNDKYLKKQLHPRFPVSNVMSPENVKDRYTEGLIRAALLRLVHRAEWGQLASMQTRSFLAEQLLVANQKIIAGELFIALGRSLLPPISAKEFKSSFAEFFHADLEIIAPIFAKG